jgi:hypothetical protein
MKNVQKNCIPYLTGKFSKLQQLKKKAIVCKGTWIVYRNGPTPGY